jgi:nicotinamide-nucleotide amidase
MTPNQEKQAMVPEGAEVFHNPVGSAPGVRVEYQEVHYFFMPGVPKEMKEIFQNSILPWLLEHRQPPVFHRSKLLRCFGAEEAKLDSLIQPLLKDRVRLGECQIAFRVSFPEIFIKLSAWADSALRAEDQLQQALFAVRNAVEPYVYGGDEETLEGVVGSLLVQKKLKLAVAESCTGGHLSHRITNVPGASEYFRGGVVAYSNELKTQLLGVSPETLERYGAVSRETAIEMAEGARSRLGSDLAVAITGIAGPSGGSEEKPVGTFHIALSDSEKTEEKKFFFPLDRERFKILASTVALNWVRKYLLTFSS